MDNKQAIEEIEDLMGNWSYLEVYSGASSEPMNVALELAIKALEKQAFFENEIDEIRDWFVDNKECLLDDAMKVADSKFKEISIENIEGEFTNIDLHFIVEDIADKIQEGILNVLDSYKRG